MAEIQHRTIKTNGINMHIAEAGEGPLVVMVHGFPELWYSYRHQVPALADAGFHAVAIDVRGYGGTDAPEPIEAYTMRNMTADVVGVLDALGEEQAVVVGHDWGAPIAWNSALLYPERYRGVVAMSVPYFPRGAVRPTDAMKQLFQDNFFYILYFQEPGVAEAELEADPVKSMRLFLYAASGDAPRTEAAWLKPKTAGFLDGMPEPGDNLPGWLTKEDIEYFADAFRKRGFRGPLNRYRNIDHDWEDLNELDGKKIEQPAMFIYGEMDGVIAMSGRSPEAMREWVPNLRIVSLPGAGHWTQQERPTEVNAAMIEFLKGL